MLCCAASWGSSRAPRRLEFDRYRLSHSQPAASAVTARPGKYRIVNRNPVRNARRTMKMRRAAAAAVGATLMAAGVGTGAAHALLDGNTTAVVTNANTATGGTSSAHVDATINTSAGMKNKFTAKNGNANASNDSRNRSG